MNILVCVKQVPDTTEIKIDPVTNTLIRSGVPSIVNPFDGYALEAAARIRDNHPDTKIIVLSMGPEQAKTALKECLAIAADKAYLVSTGEKARLVTKIKPYSTEEYTRRDKNMPDGNIFQKTGHIDKSEEIN